MTIHKQSGERFRE